MMNTIFGIVATLLSIYSFLCFIRIILTWIPELSYSKAVNTLSNICDPYMNLFRGIRWLKMGNFDFSPALALCLLGAISSLFKMLSNGGAISIGLILAMISNVIFSIISSLLVFVIIIFIVRLVIIFVNKDNYNSSSFMMNQLDSSISPLVYKIARTFSLGKTLTYKNALIISIISLFFTQLILNYASRIIFNLLINLPI